MLFSGCSAIVRDSNLSWSMAYVTELSFVGEMVERVRKTVRETY